MINGEKKLSDLIQKDKVKILCSESVLFGYDEGHARGYREGIEDGYYRGYLKGISYAEEKFKTLMQKEFGDNK